MDFKRALLTPGKSSTSLSRHLCNRPRKPEGLNIPRSLPDQINLRAPFYVLIITNSKLFDELYTSHNEKDKFVLHSMRLIKEPTQQSQATYDKEKDYLYSEEFEKISPGLSYDSGLDHRQHQYETHGYLTGLDQVQFFDNMIKLYYYLDLDKKMKAIAGGLNRKKRAVKISKHRWNIADTESHARKLKSRLCCDPGITYVLDKDEKKFVYEYRLYLNKNFEFVNVPDGLKVQYHPTIFEPVDGNHEYEINGSEEA